MFIEIEPCLEAFDFNQLDLSRLHGCKVWVWVCLEAFSVHRMEPWLGASNREQMDLCRPDGCKIGLGLPRTFCVFKMVVSQNRGTPT